MFVTALEHNPTLDSETESYPKSQATGMGFSYTLSLGETDIK